jgi:hypothetical protein
MQNEKRTISPLLYYLLTAGLTNLVFVVVGAIVFVLLSPTLKSDPILIGVIIFVLLQKSLIVGYVTYSFHKQGKFDKVWGTKVIGFYFGCLFGLLIGAFIGSKIAGGIGALIGALIFYFVGRWIGFRAGFIIGRMLDNNLPVAEISEKVVSQPSLFKRSFVIAYAIVLSLFSLVAPWFIQRRMSQQQISNSVFSLFWLGLALSVAPVVYGFFLFILGASIIELGVFAVVSSFATIIWSRKTNVENQNAG